MHLVDCISKQKKYLNLNRNGPLWYDEMLLTVVEFKIMLIGPGSCECDLREMEEERPKTESIAHKEEDLRATQEVVSSHYFLLFFLHIFSLYSSFQRQHISFVQMPNNTLLKKNTT